MFKKNEIKPSDLELLLVSSNPSINSYGTTHFRQKKIPKRETQTLTKKLKKSYEWFEKSGISKKKAAFGIAFLTGSSVGSASGAGVDVEAAVAAYTNQILNVLNSFITLNVLVDVSSSLLNTIQTPSTTAISVLKWTLYIDMAMILLAKLQSNGPKVAGLFEQLSKIKEESDYLNDIAKTMRLMDETIIKLKKAKDNQSWKLALRKPLAQFDVQMKKLEKFLIKDHLLNPLWQIDQTSSSIMENPSDFMALVKEVKKFKDMLNQQDAPFWGTAFKTSIYNFRDACKTTVFDVLPSIASLLFLTTYSFLTSFEYATRAFSSYVGPVLTATWTATSTVFMRASYILDNIFSGAIVEQTSFSFLNSLASSSLGGISFLTVLGIASNSLKAALNNIGLNDISWEIVKYSLPLIVLIALNALVYTQRKTAIWIHGKLHSPKSQLLLIPNYSLFSIDRIKDIPKEDFFTLEKKSQTADGEDLDQFINICWKKNGKLLTHTMQATEELLTQFEGNIKIIDDPVFTAAIVAATKEKVSLPLRFVNGASSVINFFAVMTSTIVNGLLASAIALAIGFAFFPSPDTATLVTLLTIAIATMFFFSICTLLISFSRYAPTPSTSLEFNGPITMQEIDSLVDRMQQPPVEGSYESVTSRFSLWNQQLPEKPRTAPTIGALKSDAAFFSINSVMDLPTFKTRKPEKKSSFCFLI